MIHNVGELRKVELLVKRAVDDERLVSLVSEDVGQEDPRDALSEIRVHDVGTDSLGEGR